MRLRPKRTVFEKKYAPNSGYQKCNRKDVAAGP